jgi:hypothetical protein
VRRSALCSVSIPRAAVVFPVHGSPTVKNNVGCLILTLPRARPIIADIRSSALRYLGPPLQLGAAERVTRPLADHERALRAAPRILDLPDPGWMLITQHGQQLGGDRDRANSRRYVRGLSGWQAANGYSEAVLRPESCACVANGVISRQGRPSTGPCVGQDRAMSIDDRLLELGLVLPAAPKMPADVAITFSWVRILGDRVLVSGHGAQNPDGSPAGPFGRVPDQVPAEQAMDSARRAALSVLASVRGAVGDLDRIAAWATVTGFVQAEPGYPQTTAIINTSRRCSSMSSALLPGSMPVRPSE